MPSLLDREVSAKSDDAFGHRHFAEALQSLIEYEKHDPPYSIGLLGGWGTGKSTIKRLYLSNLEDDVDADVVGRTRSEKIHPITFNAWRFGGSDIKRALLRHVYLELGGDERSLRDALFRQIERSTEESKSIQELWGDVWALWGWPLLQVGLAAVLVGAVVYGGSWLIDAGEITSSVIGAAAFLFAVFALKYYVKTGVPFISLRDPVNRIELPYATAEEYEDLLLEQIERFAKISERNQCERLAIFVDDLDRLSAKEMVDGLDAIRTFLDLPDHKLPEDMGVVFIISCDEQRVARAIEQKWGNSDLPGAVFSFEDARRYLDRMFQFRLEIPRFPKRDMRNFAKQKFRDKLPAITKDVEATGTSLESVVTRLMHVDVESPRNAIQIINAFVQSWWVAKRREHEGPGSERAGGLQEKVVTSHPESLAALSVLRVDYPDFYNELEQQPDLIQRFTEVFVRGGDLQDQPRSIRDALSNFSGKEDGKVKKKHKGLLRYIASLQGVQWPPSLRPLLLLTQDPTTRDLGESEIRVREDLVSGNQQGVLEALGRANDNKAFSQREVEILHNVVEELYQGDTIHQNNAASVIARLSERIPSDGLGRRLYTYLYSRLYRSGDLRYRLGAATIPSVLEKLRPLEKKNIATRLVEDVIKTEGDIDFLTEALETPSLNEALGMVRDIVPLVLQVRREHGLRPQAENMLLEWLKSRRVAVDGNEDELPFAELEKWLQTFEDSLLSDFGPQYIDLLASFLKADHEPDFDLEESLRRSREVFDEMVQTGTESRKELAGVLIRFVSVRSGSAVTLAYDFVDENAQAFGLGSFNDFVQVFAARLQKQETGESWGISGDWEEDIDALLRLVDVRIGDVQNAVTREEIEDLAIVLGQASLDEDGAERRADYATRIVGRLLKIAPENGNRVVRGWASRILGGLPVTTRKWIGKNLHRLDEETSSDLTNHINAVQNTNVAPEKADKYCEFMAELTEEGVKTNEMQSHLQSVYSYLRNNSRQQQLIERVFPALPRLIMYGPKGPAGQMIHQLFSDSRNNRPLHGILHGHMAEYWPVNEEELISYSPGTYFNYGEEYVTKYPSDNKTPDVLRSIRRMAEKKLVEEGRHSTIIDAASKLWGHDKAEALKAFESVESLPSQIGLIPNLMNAVNESSEDEFKMLRRAWNEFSKRSSVDQHHQIAMSILEKASKGTSMKPDLCLEIWFDAMGVSKANLLQGLVLSDELNEEQRKRVWLQIERTAGDLGHDFFLEVLPGLFGLGEASQAQEEALSEESKSAISELFGSRNAQHDLSGALLSALVMSDAKGRKRRIAEWIGELDTPSSLISSREDKLSEIDQEILTNYVPAYSVD